MTADLRAWAAERGPSSAAADELAEHARLDPPDAVRRLQLELGSANWAREARTTLASRLSAAGDPRAHAVGLEAAAAKVRVQVLVAALGAVQ